MPDEEYRKREYCIEYRRSEISDEEVISLIKQAIEATKKKFPGKAKALDEIEIRKEPLASTLEVDPLITLIIILTLRRIIVKTWDKIVIPLLQRKLNIEPYESYLRIKKEKLGELKKRKSQ
jgi:hypothetical protein